MKYEISNFGNRVKFVKISHGIRTSVNYLTREEAQRTIAKMKQLNIKYNISDEETKRSLLRAY